MVVEQLLTLEDVVALTKHSKADIWRQQHAGTFPAAIKTGPRSKRFRATEIQAWIETCAAQAAEASGEDG